MHESRPALTRRRCLPTSANGCGCFDGCSRGLSCITLSPPSTNSSDCAAEGDQGGAFCDEACGVAGVDGDDRDDGDADGGADVLAGVVEGAACAGAGGGDAGDGLVAEACVDYASAEAGYREA